MQAIRTCVLILFIHNELFRGLTIPAFRKWSRKFSVSGMGTPAIVVMPNVVAAEVSDNGRQGRKMSARTRPKISEGRAGTARVSPRSPDAPGELPPAHKRMQDSAAAHRRRLHDDLGHDVERCRPVQDHRGARGLGGNAHRLAAKAQRVVPEDRERADGRLDTERGRDRGPIHRPGRPEHAGVLRQEEGCVVLPDHPTGGTTGS